MAMSYWITVRSAAWTLVRALFGRLPVPVPPAPERPTVMGYTREQAIDRGLLQYIPSPADTVEGVPLPDDLAAKLKATCEVPVEPPREYVGSTMSRIQDQLGIRLWPRDGEVFVKRRRKRPRRKS